jgi:hypothetical protein
MLESRAMDGKKILMSNRRTWEGRRMEGREGGRGERGEKC